MQLYSKIKRKNKQQLMKERIFLKMIKYKLQKKKRKKKQKIQMNLEKSIPLNLILMTNKLKCKSNKKK